MLVYELLVFGCKDYGNCQEYFLVGYCPYGDGLLYWHKSISLDSKKLIDACKDFIQGKHICLCYIIDDWRIEIEVSFFKQ